MKSAFRGPDQPARRWGRSFVKLAGSAPDFPYPSSYTNAMVKGVTLRKAGGSIAATSPKEMADRLHLEPGDRALVMETEKGILLTPYVRT